MSKYVPQAPLPSTVTKDDLQTAADSLATYLRANCSQEDIDAAVAEFAVPEWPKEYRNRTTGKVYKPHGPHEATALLDTPRHILIKGGEGCIAADTLVNGVPVADLTTPSTIQTLFGLSQASRGYRKGKASLYKVVTQSGSEVTVTSEHRFLTPHGFCPLASLHAGDVIAARGDDCEPGQIGTTSNSQAGYSWDSRQRDGLPTPAELVALDKLRLLHTIACGSNATVPPPLSHSCKTRSSFHAVQIQQPTESSPHAPSIFAALFQMVCQYLAQSHRRFHRRDTSWLTHPSVTCTSSLDSVALLYQTALLALYSRSPDSFQSSQLPLPCRDALSITAESHRSQTSSVSYHDRRIYPDSEERCPPLTEIPLVPQPPFSVSQVPGTSSRQAEGQSYSPPFCNTYYTSYWTQIKSIVYVRDGDFYDVHVPFWNHYAANGLWHHNSGKSVCGIVKTLNRLRAGASGLMACVAADTLVDGIPIAERTRPAPVNTILGPVLASPSFCEGRADLFRVVTESGDRVVVTANHRFLTPLGWRPLRDLRVGDVIAADDSEHGRNWREVSPGSLGDCLMAPRLCGEPPRPQEQRGRGNGSQSFERGVGFSHSGDHPAHAYTARSSCPSASVVDAEECWPSSGADVSALSRYDVSPRVSSEASQIDNPQRWHRNPISHSVDTGARTPNGRSSWLRRSPILASILSGWQCPLSSTPGQTNPQSHRDYTCVDFSCPYYNTEYAVIASITFQRHGDFYGLTVPSTEHYSAHGLFHHNSPDLPHFKRSLWPEFQRWCPWEQVIEKHRNRGHIGWEPYQPFYLVFQNDAVLFCGGMDEPGAWEGPNVNFAFFDEARRKKKADALKVLTGRIRIPGPDDTPPQIWITTTPRKHWLYEFFGGLAMVCQDCQFTSLVSIQEGEEVRCKECGSTNLVADDPYETFKRHSKVITLFTKDNEPNLQEDFAAHRAQTLTEKEARVLLEAAWEDFEEGQPFLPSMTWWNDCREDLPPLANREPMVVGMDAAIGRTSGISDCFAIVGVTRHPSRRPNTVAVRYVKSWQAKSGGQIDFQGTDASPGPERELRHLCANYNVKVVVYDPYQLHDMATRLSRERIVWMKPFGQTNLRPKSDSDLLRLVLEKRIAHDGDALLTRHLANADRKVDPEGKRLKLVKREDTGKIDLAVALSMASYEALRLNL